MSEVQRLHEQYMRLALDEARLAAAYGEVPVGAVVVRDGIVLAAAGNRIEAANNPLGHAEMIAIQRASAQVGSRYLDDCTLYVTLEPCTMCAGAIALARITRVVYGASESKTGACGSMYDVFGDPRLPHRTIVRSGILADECSKVLTEFFQERRREESLPPQVQKEPTASGVLTLVPTPVGNIEDITARSLKALREADVILCEDTRHTGQLLARYGKVKAALVSNHDHNERERAGTVVRLLSEGRRVVLVSDAGTPAISDPGYRTVRACLEAGLDVRALPGSTALIPALAASGLPTDRFVFAGFPPTKKSARPLWLSELLATGHTIVLYESPYRVGLLLDELLTIGPRDRIMCIAREISKIHEEFIRGTVEHVSLVVAERGGIKGECVVILDGDRTET
ncbi:MAG: 16S rRNA (cytidine(1402)-2'-O)-methyltransferase [Candidatus Kapabacteria bacterium]|nr:16S rRNA (cytidine(1402)-2'-O)-methyltransferase [Candidatus Kapabacteria bacterium]